MRHARHRILRGVVMTTKIEWADATINPVVGCSHCSPGCDHCYAERFAARMAKNPNPKISGKYAGVVDEKGKWTGRVNLHMDGCLYAATVTRKPKRFFIGSMTDIFHENIPDEEIRSLFLSMTIVPNDLPTYMVLTKRPHRAKAVLGDMLVACPELHRVWLGVTVCNQAEADEKIPVLLQTPAAARFVSVEPMLEAVDLRGKLCHWTCPDGSGSWFSPVPGKVHHRLLDWVICGGETGPGARPMHPDWVRGLRDQCQGARVPFFFKSWGEWAPNCLCGAKRPHPIIQRPTPGHVGCMFKCGKRRAGRLLDGVEHNEFPEATV